MVLNEIERKTRYAAYSLCIGDTRTNAITQRSSAVTRKAVTERLKQSFQEELSKLDFQHVEVELKEVGGTEGVLYHRLVLTRAPGVELPRVVSEGEQRCLSIAAFFAELSTADDPSGIVFDDPVSSLDYKWREGVARRLVRAGPGLRFRRFSMGKRYDIVVDEVIKETDSDDSGTLVSLVGLKKGPVFESKLSTVGRNLAQRLLPYFITEGYACPDIVLSEHNGSDPIRLNDFVSNELSGFIREMPVARDGFSLKAKDNEEEFCVRVFKLYSPANQKSRISLVAHQREVSGSLLQNYVPEFKEEFYDKTEDGDDGRVRNYIVKAYVFGAYLDSNVSLERGSFEFAMNNDLLLGIAQADIEKAAAAIAQDAVGGEVRLRQEKKKERVQAYVDGEAPWHKEILNNVDLTDMPYNPTHEEIEACLQKEKFAQERAIKKDVERLLAEANVEDFKKRVSELVNKISNNGKNDLIHYVATRREILHLFGKSLKVDDSGQYSSEGVVHDIIFPRKGDTERTPFDEHHLWIVDERLNFTKYVCSDVPLDGKNTERPDLLAYNRRVLFRGDNEASNPITIFEFKKPQRDDFVNPSSPEDPVQQIIRYVNDIRDGKYKTPEGRTMLVTDNTPFYGFLVCDLTRKVETWLEREKDFKPMADRLGWFQWMSNNNLYLEVVSWDKVLKDAEMRNKIFFQKLGI